MVNQNPEQIARDEIDTLLRKAGWVVQDKKKIDFSAALGVAVREYQTDVGPADYVLFVDKQALGVIEAKPEYWGEKITTVEEQSTSYANAKLKWVNNNQPANPNAWTKDVWFYDYRTNVHHTLKKEPLRFDDLTDFIECYNPKNPSKRKETWHPENNPEARWRRYSYEELIARDKTSLDIFWLKDKSLTDLDNLPEPDDLAAEIIENLEAGLNSFREVLAGLVIK